MAKKTPKNTEKDYNPLTVTSQDGKTQAPQKAAVNVDSKNEPKKVKKAQNQKKSDKPNIFKRMWKGLKGIFSELKKVTWPKGKDVVKNTTVVLVVVVMFFVILFAMDYVLAGLLGLITKGEWATLFI